MDFGDSPAEAEFRARLRAWLVDNTPDLGASSTSDDYWAGQAAWHQSLFDAGFFGMSWPTDIGGQGMPSVYEVIVDEELTAAGAPPRPSLGYLVVGILEHGSPEIRRRFLPGIVNGSTGDQTVFQDDDGQAYLVSSSSSGRANRYVSPLRASDFLAVENAVLVYRGGGREGNCMFKYDGRYFFCSSDLHGWNSSQTYCVSATNIRGPYGAEFVMEGTQADYSHVTQTGFFFNVKGSSQTTVVFAGDRWSDFAGNGLGFNQWMPLSFTGSSPRFHSLSAWNVNVATARGASRARTTTP